MSFRRGAKVYALDGKIGQVDEFMVSPEDHQITHLMLREGHLWGKKLVIIPVSKIDRVEENQIFLRLDKLAVEALPVIPIKRHFF